MWEILRRQEKTAQNYDMFMILALLKPGTGEYEKTNKETYHRILPNMVSGDSKLSLIHI